MLTPSPKTPLLAKQEEKIFVSKKALDTLHFDHKQLFDLLKQAHKQAYTRKNFDELGQR